MLNSYNTNLFPEIKNYQTFELENRRYIGNKNKLLPWIFDILNCETKDCQIFLDLFAGTGSVSKYATKYYNEIILNDILLSNNIVYKSFFGTSYYDLDKLVSIIEFYNKVDLEILDDNYFSINYGGKFFDIINAKLIGFIREDIENMRLELTNKEYSILLTSLLYSIDKIANTVGHFDAFIKKEIKYRPLNMKLIKPFECNNYTIYNEDANILATKIQSDIVYIDPPYNSRQYNRFYHLYENLIKWDKPQLFGVALKPKPENSSVYCTVGASNAFKNLIEKISTRYIAVSYNNTYSSKSNSSENKIKLEEIETILSAKGATKVFNKDHRFFSAGKTNFNNHKEYLFITKVNNFE